MELPKIHGQIKVGIMSKEEAERMDMAGAHFHFNQRLNERYGIDITLEEYMIIRKGDLKVLRNEKHNKVGTMNIKGVDVLVVREKYRKRKLLTALPKTHKLYGTTENNAGYDKSTS